MIAAIDIDAQKTFTPLCPAELPVAEGHLIANELNAQAALADYRVMTKDAHSPAAKWICPSHADMFQPTSLPDADITWVSHAIVGSYGFELLDGLPESREYDFCVWKGVDPEMHPYGACYHDLREKLSTGLIEWLRSKGVTAILAGGLATDYCVKTTVLQLLRAGGWEVIVNRAACRAIAADTETAAWKEMQECGAVILDNAAEVAAYLKRTNRLKPA